MNSRRAHSVRMATCHTTTRRTGRCARPRGRRPRRTRSARSSPGDSSPGSSEPARPSRAAVSQYRPRGGRVSDADPRVVWEALAAAATARTASRRLLAGARRTTATTGALAARHASAGDGTILLHCFAYGCAARGDRRAPRAAHGRPVSVRPRVRRAARARPARGLHRQRQDRRQRAAGRADPRERPGRDQVSRVPVL